VKRVSILLLLLMAFVAACGGSPSATDTDTDTETPDPTAEATSEPTEEASTDPGASGGSSFEGDLADVIPDELNGVARTDIPGMDSILTSMFGAQGIDASQAQFAFATYGDGTDAVTLTAIVVPDIDDATLELISRSFSGVPGGAEAETVTVDGKTVLKVTAGAQPGSVYMYFAGGAAFTVFSQNEDLAEQLLGELP
jgi:hypothetical protein